MEQNPGTQPTFMSSILRWGLIMGAAGILLNVLMYVIDESLMVQLKMLFIALAIYMGLAIYAGIDYRNSTGGFLSYGKAFQHGFLIFAVSGLMGTLYNILLHNVIDTDLASRLTDASMENTRAMMESFGAPEDAIEKGLEDARERTASQFTIGGMALGYLFILGFSAVMAVITAIFVRKNEPVEM